MAVSGRKASIQVSSSIYKASDEELQASVQLSSSIYKASDEELQVYCQPCDKEET
jgi:hypothetical protein